MRVFEVMACVKKEGKLDSILILPEVLLAQNEEAAKLALVVQKSKAFAGYDMAEVEILARPFQVGHPALVR